jgi:DNA sulfur modification protein DndE
MKPPIETIRISAQGRDQLIRLKRITGIEHWNALCRWALCASLREETAPPSVPISTEGGIEMAWKVFAGEFSDAYAALVSMRAKKDGLHEDPDGLANCLRLHLHRGLGYLAADRESRSVGSFLQKLVDDDRFRKN